MAGVKISQLPAVSAAQTTDTFPVVQSGVTSKESLSQVITLLQSQFFPTTVPNGGTNITSATAYGPITGGTTSTGAFQSVTPGASGTLLQSGGSSALPAYTTATYPAATTANQLLYSSATNTVGGLATANSSMLITNSSGVPSLGASFLTGTWSPVITGSSANPTSISYAFQVGEYQRIGNIVFYSLRVIVSALTIGAGSGQLQISSPPITAVNTTANDPASTALVQNIAIDATTIYVVGRLMHNTQLINLMEIPVIVGNAGSAVTMAVTNISSSTDITISGFYFAA